MGARTLVVQAYSGPSAGDSDRHLILASPSHLRLSLVCRSGTPDMLVHTPPIRLIIDQVHTFETITVED